MLELQTSRLASALKRGLRKSDASDIDPSTAMDGAIEYALLEHEDVLTALVFERLRYMPPSLAWQVLVGAADVLRGDAPAFEGTLQDAAWPLLSHPTTGNPVEPDILWFSGDSVLGIEVKWKGTQTPEQLEREHAAIAHAHQEKAVTIFALGRATSQRRELLATDCRVPSLLALNWERFYAALHVARDSRGQVSHIRTLLDDLMTILALREPLWARPPLMFSSLPTWPIAMPTFLGPSAAPSQNEDPLHSFASLPFTDLPLGEVSLPTWRMP